MPIVASFRDLSEAEVASATLEAAGVTNTLFDAGMIGVVWTDSTALRWVKVHVAAEDAEEALAILQAAAEIEWPPELLAVTLEAVEHCPFCASEELALVSGPRKALAIMICLPVPLWLWRSRLVCRSCGRSRWVPLRFRPDLALAWSICAVGAMVAIVCVAAAFGFLVSALSKISG